MSALDVTEAMLVEQVVANEAPSIGVAYLLAIFLGWLSAHRFYLKRPASAVLQILSYFILIGFIWLLLDLFAIPGMVRVERAKVRDRETRRVIAGRRPVVEPAALPEPPVTAALVERLLIEAGS